MGTHAAEVVAEWGHSLTDQIKSALWWINALANRTLILAQTVGVLLLALLIMMALESRAPPVVALPVSQMDVQAGEWATLNIPVRRDMTRQCSIRYEIVLIDSGGVHFPMIGGEATADGIRAMEDRNPGMIRLGVSIPPMKRPGKDGISEGPAALLITRSSSCNPLQDAFPIRSQSSTPLYILP
jgi:hypothetical protein